MGYYPFTTSIVDELVAAGFEREVACRLVERLYLGPEATVSDVLAVARAVLAEREREAIQSRDYARLRAASRRPSTVPPRSA